MSSIQTLLMRGIRSYDPDGTETIEFLSPVTLVTGANGSGKSTIIEALRYATTGEWPPNSKNGAFFVNDPRMSGSPSVKAQVKLQFQNVNQREMIVTRSVSVSATKKGHSLKTLESVLAMHDATTGRQQSVSSKCAEIDAELPLNLGVSRAILDNVIFCHQEDSYWPMSEPAPLKKKFDEIFASTKYTNVLENIRVYRKSQSTDIQLLNAEVEHIRQNKNKAERVRQAHATGIETIAKSEERIRVLDDELEHLAADISRLMAKMRELQVLETSLHTLAQERKQVQASLREMEGTFTQYRETDTELQEMLFRHELSLKTANQERSKHEEKRSKSMTNIRNLQSSVQDNLQDMGHLRALLEAHQRKQTDRDLLIQQLASLYNFEGFQVEHTSGGATTHMATQDVRRFLDRLELQIQQHQSKVDSIKADLRAREQKVRSELSDKKAKMDMASSIRTRTANAMTAAQTKLGQQKTELQRYQTTEADLEATQRLVTEQESSLETLQSTASLEEKETQRRAKTAEIDQLENVLARLSEESAAQMQHAGARARLSLLQTESKTRRARLLELQTKHEAALKGLLKVTSVDPAMASTQLEPLVKSKEAATRSSMAQVEKARQELAAVEAQLEAVKQSLARQRQFVQESKKAIEKECGSEPLPDVLGKAEAENAEIRAAAMDYKVLGTMYGRFLDFASQKHGCPLCKRGMDEQQEAQFTASLQRMMKRAQDEEEDEELAASEAKLKVLQALRSTWDSMTRIETTEIVELENQLESLTQKRSSIVDSMEVTEMEHATQSTELEDMQPLVQAAEEMANLAQEDNKAASAIQQLEAELLCTGSTKSSDELQQEYEQVKTKIQTARGEVRQLTEEMASAQADFQRREQALRSLRERRTQLENAMERKKQVEEQMRETETAMEQLEKEAEQQRQEEQRLQPEMERLERLLLTIGNEGHAKEREAQQVVTDLQTNYERVNMYHNEIERVDTKTTQAKLSRLETSTEETNEEIQVLTREVEAMDRHTQELGEKLADLKELQRNINDNLRYRRYKSRIEELTSQESSLQAKRAQESDQSYNRQLSRLNTKQSEMNAERAGLKGELRQLESQKRAYEHELETDYLDVGQKYLDSLVKLKTIEIANSDLEKYSKALQSAIVAYHTMKMEEINRLIKELWTSTYQGNDIDWIEIRSDQEGLRANQTYNYRVVMIQQGNALDMRGRCSAGQKVLASIIIRLALAESFSVSCGILALDEPTTNLDQANIKSLAVSLSRIIEKHVRQSNFQLLIITHDEEFLQMMNVSDYVDHFYRVSKDARQFSKIDKLPITAI
ncbi:DNA repair protein rad50 [Actinomortierella ambigua]|nr:DNA repair protein rad50 [Actinomortierella ambigua]